MNEPKPFSANVNDGAFSWEELQPGELDVLPMQDGRFHLIHRHKTYVAELIAADYQRKTFSFYLNGSRFDVQLGDEYDRLVKALGLHIKSGGHVGDIHAPMPGLVLDISVQPGQQVQKGETLLILEAMKMENVIKSPGDGTVKAVRVSKGEAVEKGHVLVEIEG